MVSLEPFIEEIEVEIEDFPEDRSIGSEGDRGPRSIRAPRHFELARRNAGFVHLLVDRPVLVDHEVQAFGHGIDGADADSMKATGDLVGRGIEFATGMEIRHDELCGTDAALRACPRECRVHCPELASPHPEGASR